MQLRFTGYIPRIPSVSGDHGKSLALKSLSNDNQATKFTGVLTLLEAMLLAVKQRVQQEVNIYQFEVDDIYCQLKEIMDFRKDKLKY